MTLMKERLLAFDTDKRENELCELFQDDFISSMRYFHEIKYHKTSIMGIMRLSPRKHPLFVIVLL